MDWKILECPIYDVILLIIDGQVGITINEI